MALPSRATGAGYCLDGQATASPTARTTVVSALQDAITQPEGDVTVSWKSPCLEQSAVALHIPLLHGSTTGASVIAIKRVT
jgi:hypothetical protein